MEEEFVYRNQKRLRRGYTTGSCAAAASCAAADMLLTGEWVPAVKLMTPKGILLHLSIEEIERGPGWVSCGVRKDAGDDPDVTDGMVIFVRAEFGEGNPETDYVQGEGPILWLSGGEGIGRVTKPGLSCPVGKAAINPVPRSMIVSQTEAVCRERGFTGSLKLTVYAPEGKTAAEKTFNPYLGILGGISILGTTGIVEPMSEAALVETIRLSLKQRAALGERDALVVPGNYGEAFLRDRLGISVNRAVKCSNYIGETLDMAAELGFERLLLVGHGGKLIKLAAGIMNTHSRQADGRGEVLAAYGAACGASVSSVEALLSAITVEEAVDILEREGLREPVMKRILERVEFHLKKRAGTALQAEALLFTNQKGVLGMTTGAETLLKDFRRKEETDG